MYYILCITITKSFSSLISILFVAIFEMKYLKYNEQDTSYFFTKIYLFIQVIYSRHSFTQVIFKSLLCSTLTSIGSSKRGTDPILFIALFPVFSGVSST